MTLTCLMLVGLPLMDAMTQTVQAQEYLFTINLVVAYESAGYWDIASAFKAELANLGINVVLQYMDAGTYYDVVWDTGWNKTWDDGGWDMDLSTFWWMPTDLVWFEGCYSEAGQPPYGWNYFGWENEDADKQLRLCMSTVDPGLRKKYIDKWQEVFMQDPPHISLFYPLAYEVTDADLEGWDLIRWWYDTDGLKFANTTLEDDVTLNYGSAEDLLTLNPLFTLSLGSETFTDQCFDMLMKTSSYPNGTAYLKPSLAAEPPVYSPDGMSCNVTLRQNVTWHDEWPFNATDVKFTFDAVIDAATWCSGYGDFAPVIDSVDILGEFKVRFNFKAPSPHFDTLLADDYGALIVPEHVLRDVPHKDWRRHATNTQTPMPGTGRWKFEKWQRDEWWLVVANEDYFLGESLIDRIYNYVITDPSAGLIALQTHQIDFGDCWTATIEEIQTINETDPTLKVTSLPYPAVQYFGFNLHHPQLSNMYVRKAIAHLIPYEHIIKDLLPTLGMTGVRATGPITPEQGNFYNSLLTPFEYDPAKAQKYLDMWKYSLPEYAPEGSPEVALGPVGDGDFNGVVDMDDYVVWADRMVYNQPTPGTWPFRSGHPIDPDFDNSGYADGADFFKWRENIGETYPF